MRFPVYIIRNLVSHSKMSVVIELVKKQNYFSLCQRSIGFTIEVGVLLHAIMLYQGNSTI